MKMKIREAMSEKPKAYIQCAFPPCQNFISPDLDPRLCKKHREMFDEWQFKVWLTRLAQQEAQGQAVKSELWSPGKGV